MKVTHISSRLKENGGVDSLNKQVLPKQGKFGKDVSNRNQALKSSSISSLEQGAKPQLLPPQPESIVRSLTHLLEKCEKYRFSKDFMQHQPFINEKMRSILVDWMVDVCQKFKLLPQTIFMSVALVDRFLSKSRVERSRLQLVGVTCVMIIGKYEEIYPPTLKDFVSVCDNTYTAEEILEMESTILLAIDFDLTPPVSFVMLEYFQQFLGLEEKEFTFCHYFLESTLLDLSYLDFSPSELAAGTLYLTNKLFKKGIWSQKEEEVTEISTVRVKTCAKQIYAIMHANDGLELSAIKCKFGSPKFHEVSRFRIEKVGN